MTEEELLKSIDFKLGQLITLTKVLNREKVGSLRQKIALDKENSAIMGICDEPTSFSDILTKVKTSTGAGETTIKERLGELREMGAVTTSRQGKQVFYVNSGLLD